MINRNYRFPTVRQGVARKTTVSFQQKLFWNLDNWIDPTDTESYSLTSPTFTNDMCGQGRQCKRSLLLLGKVINPYINLLLSDSSLQVTPHQLQVVYQNYQQLSPAAMYGTWRTSHRYIYCTEISSWKPSKSTQYSTENPSLFNIHGPFLNCLNSGSRMTTTAD